MYVCSVMQLQVVIALMLKSFVVRPVPGVKVKMMPNQFLMIPAVEGKEGKGSQVPLVLESID